MPDADTVPEARLPDTLFLSFSHTSSFFTAPADSTVSFLLFEVF